MKVEGLNGSGVKAAAAAATGKPIDRVEKLEKEAANLNMAVRIVQMLLKQVMEQLETIKNDTKQTTSMINDFQYRLLALQGVTGADVAAVAKVADELKLNDWNEASNHQDTDGGFVSTNVVTAETDTVILTSTTPDVTPDAGIFRSRTVLAETGNKELITALLNKNVGDKFDFQLAGNRHVIELLGVRVKPEAEKPAEGTTVQ
jgi:hypothetical protein